MQYEADATRSPMVFVSPAEHRKVVFASTLGTIFEWYDFTLYAALAPFFASLFFPPGNATAALLAAFATYAAGFLIRPVGALVFGHIGDRVGRKAAFLLTVVLMGVSTFAMGLLPSFADIGWAAPVLLVLLRLTQGFAIGGEYGGAVIYVAEHTPAHQRGLATGWIQMTVSVAFLISLAIVVLCRSAMSAEQFREWGWRVPFLLSIFLLVFSAYIRLSLRETPLFQHMKALGKGSRSPIAESFLRLRNLRLVLSALFGTVGGTAVIAYSTQFYVLYFMQVTLKVDFVLACTLLMIGLLISTPFFIFAGWLSDLVGRKPLILAGTFMAAISLMPIYMGLTRAANPDLVAFQSGTRITLATNKADCHLHIFIGPWTQYSDCDRTRGYLTKLGLSFETVDRPGEPGGVVIGGDVELPIENWEKTDAAQKVLQALKARGYPEKADPAKMNMPVIIFLLTVLDVFICIVYGPLAAFLVELFPTRVRYTAVSLPYHIGFGWFGGLLPLMATAMAASAGNIYYGLWYPITVAAVTFVLGLVLLPNRRGTELTHD